MRLTLGMFKAPRIAPSSISPSVPSSSEIAPGIATSFSPLSPVSIDRMAFCTDS